MDSLGLVAVPGQFGFGHTQNLTPPLGPMGTLDRTGFHSGTDLQSLGSALPFVGEICWSSWLVFSDVLLRFYN